MVAPWVDTLATPHPFAVNTPHGTRELHWLRFPRCLCAVFPLTMCPFHSRAVTLMSVVPTPYVLDAWLVVLRDARDPKPLDELFVTSWFLCQNVSLLL